MTTDRRHPVQSRFADNRVLQALVAWLVGLHVAGTYRGNSKPEDADTANDNVTITVTGTKGSDDTVDVTVTDDAMTLTS